MPHAFVELAGGTRTTGLAISPQRAIPVNGKRHPEAVLMKRSIG